MTLEMIPQTAADSVGTLITVIICVVACWLIAERTYR